jgi:sec-independent protein translocase protein TatC
VAFRFLLSFSGPLGVQGFEVKPTVMIGDYIDFVTQALIGFGLAFELPVLVFFLSAAGLITYRHMLRFARYFIVIAFTIGAIFTPPDVMSQIFLSGALCVLYGISIGVAWLFGKRPGRVEP